MKTLALLFTIVLFSIQSEAQIRKIRECIIENGVLKEVEGNYNPANGEKTLMFNGKMTDYEKIGNTKDYAHNTSWFKNNDAITYKGNKYVKYGLPRILGVSEIELSDKYDGVGVYIESGFTGQVEVVYIPVRQGCEFQPYQLQIPECGKVTITPSIKTVPREKSVKLTATVVGTKEVFSYTWTANVGTIVGSNRQKTVAVSSKGVSTEIDMSLTVTGKNCVSYEYITVPVAK